MARTKDETLREITLDYLAKINVQNPPTPANIQADILDATNLQFQLENTNRAKGSSWKIPDRLTPAQIADILMTLYPIVNIAYGGLNADIEFDVLSIYQSDGIDKGIYTSSKQMFSRLIHQYCYTFSEKETNETLALLKDRAPRVVRSSDRNLIAVNNGIFDYDTKETIDNKGNAVTSTANMLCGVFIPPLSVVSDECNNRFTVKSCKKIQSVFGQTDHYEVTL